MTNPGEVSPLDREIAASLRAEQPQYRFEPLDSYPELGDKTFIATIGPTGSGKSTLTDAVIDLAPEFTFVFDTDDAYGTAPEDIGEYTIGPILGDSVEDFMTAGFKRFYPIFTVVRGGLYQQRLEKERMQLPDIRNRLAEAMGSLTFARLNVDAPWMSFIDTGDSEEELRSAAKDVIRIAYQNTHPVMTVQRKLQLLGEMESAVQNVARQLR